MLVFNGLLKFCKSMVVYPGSKDWKWRRHGITITGTFLLIRLCFSCNQNFFDRSLPQKKLKSIFSCFLKAVDCASVTARFWACTQQWSWVCNWLRRKIQSIFVPPCKIKPESVDPKEWKLVRLLPNSQYPNSLNQITWAHLVRNLSVPTQIVRTQLDISQLFHNQKFLNPFVGAKNTK